MSEPDAGSGSNGHKQLALIRWFPSRPDNPRHVGGSSPTEHFDATASGETKVLVEFSLGVAAHRTVHGLVALQLAVGVQNPDRSCRDSVILADQTAQHIAPPNAAGIGR